MVGHGLGGWDSGPHGGSSPGAGTEARILGEQLFCNLSYVRVVCNYETQLNSKNATPRHRDCRKGREMSGAAEARTTPSAPTCSQSGALSWEAE